MAGIAVGLYQEEVLVSAGRTGQNLYLEMDELVRKQKQERLESGSGKGYGCLIK